MSTKLETETFAGKTIQAWKDQATKAGLVLRAPADVTDPGDFPDNIYSSLRRFRRNIAITKDHKKIVTRMTRQLVSERDQNGKPTKKECLTYQGYYSGITHKGEENHADFEIGKYIKPRIVHNANLRYDPKTGDPIGNEKMFLFVANYAPDKTSVFTDTANLVTVFPCGLFQKYMHFFIPTPS